MTLLALTLAIVVAVVSAGLVYRAIWLLRRKREARAVGLREMGSMRWREFARLVLEALNQRGYQLVSRTERAEDDNQGASEYVLSRDGQRWLLWIKQDGMLGGTTVAEMGNDIRASAAAGGLLVTPGRIEGDARERARLQHIDLLDGPMLWPELEPLMPDEIRSDITTEVDRAARRLLLLALVGCAALALTVGLVVPRLLAPGADDSTPPPVPTTSIPEPAPAVTPTQPGVSPARDVEQPGGPGPIATTATDAAPTDPAALERRRIELAESISTLAVVGRAAWASQSTLVVFLATTDGADPIQVICPLVERYEELRTSRLQLQSPTGGPVRFRQCKSF